MLVEPSLVERLSHFKLPATAELTYLNTIVAREVTNGMWFIASLFLLATLLKFLAPVIRRDARIWLYGPDIKLAWAIMLIALGSTLRAGWIWALLVTSDLKMLRTVIFLQDMVVISYVALAVGIWGCVCAVKAITEAVKGYSRWGYWLFMTVTTVSVPLAVNVWLAMLDGD